MILYKGQRLYHKYGSDCILTRITKLVQNQNTHEVIVTFEKTVLPRLAAIRSLGWLLNGIIWYGPFTDDLRIFVEGICKKRSAKEPPAKVEISYVNVVDAPNDIQKA